MADGHITDIPVESDYSRVVSLCDTRIIVLLVNTNIMETWATDIGNTYIETKTLNKFYIIAGTEFSDREGQILVLF